MAGLLEVPLAGGGSFLVRAVPDPVEGPLAGSGPVRAGRVSERVGEGVQAAAASLQTMLAPVVAMSRAVLDQLAEAGPGQVQVEFGVELTAEAGAVVTKTAGACHLTVTLTWGGGQEAGPGPVPVAGQGQVAGQGPGLVAGQGAG